MMIESKSRPILQGLALIVVGLVFILGNFGAFRPNWEVFFTWMIIILGVLFWVGFMMDRSRDFLIMPATILVIYGVVFFLIAKYTWATIENMGPLFILAPALGLYMTYLISKRNRSLLITSAVLGVISLIFLLNSVPVLKYIWPILTVALGVFIIVNPEKKIEMTGGGPDA
jgi:hypothetical protein